MSFCGLCGGGRSADDPEHECGAVRTALQEAVILAAVVWCNSGDDYRLDDAIVHAVDALLAAEPRWGKGEL